MENLILAGFDIKLWPLEAVSRLFMDVMKCPTLKKVGKVSARWPRQFETSESRDENQQKKNVCDVSGNQLP